MKSIQADMDHFRQDLRTGAIQKAYRALIRPVVIRGVVYIRSSTPTAARADYFACDLSAIRLHAVCTSAFRRTRTVIPRILPARRPVANCSLSSAGMSLSAMSDAALSPK